MSRDLQSLVAATLLFVSPLCTIPPHPRQIPFRLRDSVKAELRKMESAGVIAQSEAEWRSPLVPVKSLMAVCVDFREEANKLTPLRRHWLPSLAEIMDMVGNCCCISKLDLTAGFHQIVLNEESRD